MIALTTGIGYFDLRFLDAPRIIATGVLHGSAGVALVDPGPSSTLPTLRRELESAGIAMPDVRALLLTHIHLDHAGATGTLVRENPGLRVYVHERGAPHMVNPEKLLASAARLYEGEMQRLWGDVLPVPEQAITVLTDKDRISAGGREIDVLYTPGHASHHVSYFPRDSGVGFVGDTAGIRRGTDNFILPPTPPPDIDLEVWRESLAKIGSMQPDTLFVTHYGAYGPAAAHLAEMRENLELVGDLAKRSLGTEGTDEERETWYAEEIRALLRRRMPGPEAHAYEVAGRFDLNWRGLARYWRKRA